MGHGKGSQEEENPFFVKKTKAPADLAGALSNLNLDLLPALVLHEIGYNRDIDVFSLIGLNAPVYVE